MSDEFSFEELSTIRQHIGQKSCEEIAVTIGRSITAVQGVYNRLLNQPEFRHIRAKIKLEKAQAESRKRQDRKSSKEKQVSKITTPDIAVVNSPEVPVRKIRKKKVRKPKPERPVKIEKVKQPTRKELKREERKRQIDIEEKRRIEKEAQAKNQVYKTREINFGALKSVRVDSKTIIQIPADMDEQKAIRNYRATEGSNVIRTKIKYHNF